ncbi:MAG TPA: YghX family hydrolase [Gammaproteobacteria bacterium]|nr:YghX family hydrolase [Gammaproteobacteria bacterium]
MTRKKARDFDQRLLDLYDRYAHDVISRREFLEKAGRYAVGGLTAASLLDMLSPQYAFATQVPPDDQHIKAQFIDYESPKGYDKVHAYLVRPAGATAKLPGVVVVHENRGLNPYIEDVARRLAVAGFMALAPDGLTSLGGYPGDDETGKKMQRTLNPAKMLQDFMAGFRYLKDRPDCTGKVGVVGFCYGGGVANQMAVHLPDLAAAVPFYGPQPSADEVPSIHAPLLLHYAGLDKRVTSGWPAYERELKAAHKQFTAYIYPDVNHGFHNDTTPRYDEAAAELAWKRTIAFFNAHLKQP